MVNAPPAFVLIISGPPGTGKTTLARRLAADLRLPYLGKDVIKEALFDTLGWSDRQWSRRLGGATMRLLYTWLEAELAAGRSCLVESNFRPAFANADFAALLARYPFRACQVLLHTAGPVLLARYTARASHGARHPGHVDHLTLAEIRPELERGFADPLALPGPVIRVDTTDFSALDYPALQAAVRDAAFPPFA